MIADTRIDEIHGWLQGRLPTDWNGPASEIVTDRDEVTVTLQLNDVEAGDDVSEAQRAAMRSGRAKAFREDSRPLRMKIAGEAEALFDRKISWGVRLGDHRELFTHAPVPVMTRLKQPQRQVLDTLIDAGVARSRSEALAWCVRLVGQHSDEWLTELREAMSHVEHVRQRGPVN